MLLQIPEVLTAEQVAQARQILDQTDWVDGRVTAGHQSARAKNSVAERSVRMRCGVPATCRIALSTWLPNDCPPW